MLLNLQINYSLLTIRKRTPIIIGPCGPLPDPLNFTGCPLSIKKRKSAATKRRLDLIISSYAGDAAPARAALADGEPSARASALLALEKLGELTANELTAALSDPDAAVRRRACELAALHPNVPLSQSLEDTDAYVIEMALWSLGEREEPTDLAVICKIAKEHPESLVREAAVAALGAIGDPRGLDTIFEALKDRPTVRRRAAVALAAFDGETVTEALRLATRDKDWQTRQIAEDLLEITEGSAD